MSLALYILTGVMLMLFLWTILIARTPRDWRRLWQDIVHPGVEISVNRNKRLDELVRRYAVMAGGVFLICAALLFLGATRVLVEERRQPTRATHIEVEEIQRMEESERRERARELLHAPGRMPD